MADLRFVALDSEAVDALRDCAPDANGQPAERQTSDGGGNPCRHCLDDIAKGAPMLVLAHRPFPAPQPYAEVGPIFVHGEDCPRYGNTKRVKRPPSNNCGRHRPTTRVITTTTHYCTRMQPAPIRRFGQRTTKTATAYSLCFRPRI